MRKKMFIIAATVAAMMFALPQAGKAQVDARPYIDMSTTVKREVTPDELYLRIVISESDYKGKKSLEEMQEAMIGALKENRIDIPECLSINYMGSEVSYSTFSKKIKPKTEATYTLKLYDATIMQQVIASLEKRQISDIQLSQTKFTKEQELKNEMAVEAIQQAQAEARVLAGAIGQDIGKAISINSWMNSGQTQPRLYKARANMMLEDAVADESMESSPVINIGKITYSFNVNVRFELK
jgi:uncharacterized protein YggE